MLCKFRVDASTEIGTGHVVRCLTLADALTDYGAICEFICRPHDGHLIGEIKRHGYNVAVLPELDPDLVEIDATYLHSHWLRTTASRDVEDTLYAFGNSTPDLLIIDHYAIDARWEKIARKHSKKTLVIDDLADRPHECDILLDHGIERTKASYSGLISSETAVLKWSGKFGQRAKVYPTRLNGYGNDEATELFRQI